MSLAKAAREGGMQSALKAAEETSGWRGGVLSYPLSVEHNVERLLSMDSNEFASIMMRWGDWYGTDKVFVSNLSDDEVGSISQPALIMPLSDEIHPYYMSERLHSLTPNKFKDPLVNNNEIGVHK